MGLLLIIFWISWFGWWILALHFAFALNAISWFLSDKHFLRSKYIGAKLKRSSIVDRWYLLRKNNWFSIDLNWCLWLILIIEVSPMPLGHVVGLSPASSNRARALWINLNGLRTQIWLTLILSVHFGGAGDCQSRLQINIVVAQIRLWAFLHQHLVGIQKVDGPVLPLTILLHAGQAWLGFVQLP